MESFTAQDVTLVVSIKLGPKYIFAPFLDAMVSSLYRLVVAGDAVM